MSSINSHFTFEYSQPDEYRLSHDSVFLARRVFELIKLEKIEINSCLDLCCGTGVVGLDLLYHLSGQSSDQMPSGFDFLDIQDIYKEHFLKNCAELKSKKKIDTALKFYTANYEDTSFIENNYEKYDLIVCNPPYFRLGMGALSPSSFKNRCRYFIDSDFIKLIKSIENLLKKNAHCFLITRSLENHGVDVISEITSNSNLKVSSLDPIRKSLFLKLTKL